MRIKVISDSTCDLSAQLLAENNITLAPLTVIKADEQFQDSVTITPADIFDHVAKGGALCSTAAVSIGDYADLFEKYNGRATFFVLGQLVPTYNESLKYVYEKGKILPRRVTGTCAAHQRELTVAIKRARYLALLPYSAD